MSIQNMNNFTAKPIIENDPEALSKLSSLEARCKEPFKEIKVPFDPKPITETFPLHLSIYLGRKECAKIFIEHGANIDELDKSNGFSPLHYAALTNDLEIAKLLISKHAEVNKIGDRVLTPLHIATEHKHHQMMLLLIQSGSNVNAQNFEGTAPLHSAIFNNDEKAIALLLKHGALIDCVKNGQYTAIKYAEHLKRDNLVSLLNKNSQLMEESDEELVKGESGKLPEIDESKIEISYPPVDVYQRYHDPVKVIKESQKKGNIEDIRKQQQIFANYKRMEAKKKQTKAPKVTEVKPKPAKKKLSDKEMEDFFADFEKDLEQSKNSKKKNQKQEQSKVEPPKPAKQNNTVKPKKEEPKPKAVAKPANNTQKKAEKAKVVSKPAKEVQKKEEKPANVIEEKPVKVIEEKPVKAVEEKKEDKKPEAEKRRGQFIKKKFAMDSQSDSDSDIEIPQFKQEKKEEPPKPQANEQQIDQSYLESLQNQQLKILEEMKQMKQAMQYPMGVMPQNYPQMPPMQQGFYMPPQPMPYPMMMPQNYPQMPPQGGEYMQQQGMPYQMNTPPPPPPMTYPGEQMAPPGYGVANQQGPKQRDLCGLLNKIEDMEKILRPEMEGAKNIPLNGMCSNCQSKPSESICPVCSKDFCYNCFLEHNHKE